VPAINDVVAVFAAQHPDRRQRGGPAVGERDSLPAAPPAGDPPSGASRDLSAPRPQEVVVGVGDRHARRAAEEHAATVRTDRRRILNRSVIRAPDGARVQLALAAHGSLTSFRRPIRSTRPHNRTAKPPVGVHRKLLAA
jgi:hypothetical protein